MAVGNPTRRPSPIVLVSLALLIGVCGLLAPGSSLAGSLAGAGLPANSATTTVSADKTVAPPVVGSYAVAHPVDHAVSRGSDAGAHSRVSWQRQTGGSAPSATAVLFAALVGGLLASRRSAGSWGATGPASDGRFVRDSRAPPRRLLPA
jgi:hypothetical protein